MIVDYVFSRCLHVIFLQYQYYMDVDVVFVTQLVVKNFTKCYLFVKILLILKLSTDNIPMIQS